MKLRQVIATRRLTKSSGRGAVLVSIGMPKRATTGEWICPYAIRGAGIRGVRAAHGENSVQALLIAAEQVRVALSASGTRAYWVEPGSHGFPKHVPDCFGEVGRIIDREVNRFAREQMRRGNARLRRRAADRSGLS